jgi:branched-chain amino acid transport system permease protein
VTARRLGEPLAGALALTVFVVLGALAYTATGGAGREVLVNEMFLSIMVVMGLQVFVGNTGVLSLGHIGFAAIAGYTTFLLAAPESAKTIRIPDAPFGVDTVQITPLAATLAGVALTVVVAGVVAAALARAPDITATMITVAFLFVVHAVATNWQDLTGGAGGLADITIRFTSRTWLYVGLVVAVVVARLFKASTPGRFALASSEDEVATSALGISVPWTRTVALLVSAALVGLAAALRVQSLGAVSAKEYYFGFTLLTLAMLIVGGKRSVTGALVGVVLITALKEFAIKRAGDSEQLGALPELLEGLAVLGVMLLRPKGLLGDWELDHVFHRWRRRRPAPAVPEAPVPATEAAPVTVLRAREIAVRFGGFVALDGVDLEARSDRITGLIGPNGAGKTTLVNVLTGLVEPTEGRVDLGDTELTTHGPATIARAGLARTFQNLRLFPELSVRENVEIAAQSARRHRRHRPAPDVDVLITMAGLWDRQDRRAGELDYGSQRKLELARAAALRPTFLLLDEPTSGMSEVESVAMIDHVRATAAAVGAGVLVIDHDLHFITRICDRITVLDQGRVIAEGTPAEVIEDPAVVAAYLGGDTPRPAAAPAPASALPPRSDPALDPRPDPTPDPAG